VTFTEEDLLQNCAYLSGGDADWSQHHNLLVMWDGWLLMPWAPEWGQGGITLFDITDPCAPVAVAGGFSETMRETHSIGFMDTPDGRRYAAVNSIETAFDGGIEFWELTDLEVMERISIQNMPGYLYPDAYARLTLSLFWQAPWVYVAGSDNGVYVIDASDPHAPVFVRQVTFDPVLRAGQVQAIGNLLVVTAAEGARTVLLDIADPSDPQPIPGGDFLATDENGEPKEAYFTNFNGGYIWYARKQGGGGIMVMDVREPSSPAFAGSIRTENGNGGYVFLHEDWAFTGESRFACIYDVSDLDDIREVARLNLEGDLDTMTPVGNLAVLSVDDRGRPGQGTAIAPWQQEPDTRPPVVNFVWPPDGAIDLPLTSRIGFTASEMVLVESVHAGSVRLYEADTDPALTRVDVLLSVQESIVNVHPLAPLQRDTLYQLDVPAGGLSDWSGNALQEAFTMRFRTAAP
jgi:hypothetical protein